jgi:hypothetical protein
VTGRSVLCALVLHSASFCAVFVLGCVQTCWAVGWRLVGIASAIGALHRPRSSWLHRREQLVRWRIGVLVPLNTHATLALQAGIHPKVVSERLGHATISITLDTYSHAIPAMQEEAAALIAGLVFADK